MRERTPEEQKKYDEVQKRRAELKRIEEPKGYLREDGYWGLTEKLIRPNFKRLREKFGPIQEIYTRFATEGDYLEWFEDNRG